MTVGLLAIKGNIAMAMAWWRLRVTIQSCHLLPGSCWLLCGSFQRWKMLAYQCSRKASMVTRMPSSSDSSWRYSQRLRFRRVEKEPDFSISDQNRDTKHSCWYDYHPGHRLRHSNLENILSQTCGTGSLKRCHCKKLRMDMMARKSAGACVTRSKSNFAKTSFVSVSLYFARSFAVNSCPILWYCRIRRAQHFDGAAELKQEHDGSWFGASREGTVACAALTTECWCCFSWRSAGRNIELQHTKAQRKKIVALQHTLRSSLAKLRRRSLHVDTSVPLEAGKSQRRVRFYVYDVFFSIYYCTIRPSRWLHLRLQLWEVHLGSAGALQHGRVGS